VKKLILVLVALGGGIYFLGKALWSLAWRSVLLASLLSPAAMGVYLAYAINVLHWKIETLWVMPPLLLLSLAVGHREFSWTEPLTKRS
jgi:hypothetical protein